MEPTAIDRYLEEKGDLLDKLLESYIPLEETHPSVIHQAMRYSLFSRSKKIRPILALAAGEAFECPEEIIVPYACALELIHTHSLIHDDLPSMDNDDFRRGKPASHKIYGEGMAILAGNGLLVLAFDILSRPFCEPARQLEALNYLCRAIGTEKGLLGGQVMDLSLQGKEFSKEDLQYVHSSKTGALIEASVTGAAILSGASGAERSRIHSFGKKVGLAFQIVDDLLDETGSEEKMGKKAGKDRQQQKATYPALYGIEESKAKAKELVDESVTDLGWLGDKGSTLAELARFIADRGF